MKNSKVSKRLRGLVLLSSLVFFVGCSSPQEKAIDNMYDALENGNVEKFKNSVTNSTANLIFMSLNMQCHPTDKDFKSKSRNEQLSYCMKQVFSDQKHKVVEIKEISAVEAKAIVSNESDGKFVNETLDLVKHGDDWKVNIHK
jgi:hypothetical protein